MQPKKLKLPTTLLLLLPLCVVLLGVGCEKDNSYEEISLEYIKCPCDSETSFIGKISKNNILLFDANKTSISEMQELAGDGLKAEYFVYYPDQDSAIYLNFENVNVAYNNSVGYFCNFPQSVKEWTIPYEGIYISFAADEYEPCNGYPAIAFDTYTENILTSLKKHTK